MDSTLPPDYQTQIVPALRKIQKQFGYLTPEALRGFSLKSKIPLYQLQAVASFFPHFRLSPPSTVTVSVCRDMACHLAGSARILAELKKLHGEKVCVEGVSCLGRCDRPPAAFVSIHKSDDEMYYLGRSAAQIESIVKACLAGNPPKADHDADLPYSAVNWAIDPYLGKPSDYTSARRAAAMRSESLHGAADFLRSDCGWSPARAEQFRQTAERRIKVDSKADPDLYEAVLAWQTANRKKNEKFGAFEKFGNWADVLLTELDAKGNADLRGMGGAGIPATLKWRDVRDAVRTARVRAADDDSAYIVVNGDESEPATFKDRELLLRTPHLIIEGVILAGLITEAVKGFIYIRHEYHEQIHACEEEVKRAEDLGICGDQELALHRKFPIEVYTSPGGYICGEQSALIEAMSGRRGEPRQQPPKLETNGYQDLPTLVSNVETFAWAPLILHQEGNGAAYRAMGTNGWAGRRFFSVSGDVVRPGVYEVPMGLKLRELIFGKEYCQGMKGNKKLKAFAPSGPSGGFLPPKIPVKPASFKEDRLVKWQEFCKRSNIPDPATATHVDLLEMELELELFRLLSPTAGLGAGVVVYNEERDLVKQALNSMEFFRNESCGKCVPCRVGSQKMVALGTNLVKRQIDTARWKKDFLPLVKELDDVMDGSSICSLGRSVPVPMRTLISLFPAELERYTAAASQVKAAVSLEAEK
jgi:NADH:ubiquinone oxidoreductase subunit F (NADH-binding)/NADH:ubiquinone oxidoreductase subunit E